MRPEYALAILRDEVAKENEGRGAEEPYNRALLAYIDSLEEQLQTVEKDRDVATNWGRDLVETVDGLRAELGRTQEQFDAIRFAMCEIHEYHCGCEEPGSASRCAMTPLAEWQAITRADIEWAYERGRAMLASTPAKERL